MRKYCILTVFCCLSYLAAAQSPVEKGLESINRTSAEAYIGFLAHDELQGREAGYHGSKVAAQYIASLLQAMGIQPLGDSYFQPFEAYRRERQKRGRLEVHPDSITIFKKEVHQKLSMANVLGMIPGKNTGEYAIVGAHFDHLGTDTAKLEAAVGFKPATPLSVGIPKFVEWFKWWKAESAKSADSKKH